jgi:hypothetical protein
VNYIQQDLKTRQSAQMLPPVVRVTRYTGVGASSCTVRSTSSFDLTPGSESRVKRTQTNNIILIPDTFEECNVCARFDCFLEPVDRLFHAICLCGVCAGDEHDVRAGSRLTRSGGSTDAGEKLGQGRICFPTIHANQDGDLRQPEMKAIRDADDRRRWPQRLVWTFGPLCHFIN